jgi:DNA-binding NarL/FixJ family response regulator
MIRILLMDGTRLFLEMLAERIGAEAGFKVVGTAQDCDTGLQIATERMPDLVMLDVGLPGIGSFECAAETLRLVPGTRVVFLTTCLCDVFLDAALRLDAGGYLLKDDDSQTLFDHLRRIAGGERCFSDGVKQRLQRGTRQERLRSRAAACLTTLSLHQLEVLRHLARGDSVKEVAAKVDQTPRSVEALKYRIMQQLGLHDRVALARFAIREGLTLP